MEVVRVWRIGSSTGSGLFVSDEAAVTAAAYAGRCRAHRVLAGWAFLDAPGVPTVADERRR